MHIWVIENFDMCFQPTKFFEPVISSPWMYAGNPPHSVWCLELYSSLTTENKRTLEYRIKLLDGSCSADYTSKVLLVGPDGKTKKVEEHGTHLHSINEDRCLIDDTFFLRDILTLKFLLTFKDDSTLVHMTDLTDLSQKIRSLYGNKEFSDITLYTSKKEFFLHKFLLRKRAPELFTCLGLRSENIEIDRVKVDCLSSPVLETVLKYVYSGKLDSLSEEYVPELYETLKKYQFKEFDKEIVRLRPHSTIYTHVKVERRNIYWYLKVNKSLNQVEEALVDVEESSNVSQALNNDSQIAKSETLNDDSQIEKSETLNDDSKIEKSETSNDDSQIEESKISNDESYIDFSKTASGKLPYWKHIYIGHARFLIELATDQEIFLHINIRCVSSLENDILLNCKTSLGVDEKNLVPHSKKFLLFSREKKVHYLRTYYKDSTKGSLVLQLNLAVSEGEHMSSVDGAILISPEEQSVFGMGLLSYQLQDILVKFGDTKDVNEMEDMSVNFKDGSIKCHKAILAICSAKFYRKILRMVEKKSDKIDILEIDLNTGKRIVRYMYSNQLTKNHFAEYDMELYVAAKKVLMFCLFTKCSRLLESHIKENNACEILVLANNNNDESLIQEVEHYIESHRAILDSGEWISLIDTTHNHLLVSRILKYISHASVPVCQK